jgi:hypothetical protein
MIGWDDGKPAGGDPWFKWLGLARVEVHAEILAAWDKVRRKPGRSPLDQAIEMAFRHPLMPPADVMESRPDGYEKFVSLAGWLQAASGGQNILLPVADVGELLGVRPLTVSRYRQWAVEDGYLAEVRPYSFHSQRARNRATEFRFNLDAFPVLVGAAARVEGVPSPAAFAAPAWPADFLRFWDAYPRKVAKREALKAWEKLAPDATLLQTMLDALEWQRLSPQWLKDDGKYIPYPQNWLAKARWEDQRPAGLLTAKERYAEVLARREANRKRDEKAIPFSTVAEWLGKTRPEGNERPDSLSPSTPGAG